MTTIGDICLILENFAPLSLQESYDNTGLILGNSEDPVTGILTSLDVTEAVLDEAMELGYNLIVTHHPLIFNGVKRINGKNTLDKCLIKAIRNNISLYAGHTNVDSVRGGVNERMADKLGLSGKALLNCTDGAGEKGVGQGMIGSLSETMTETDFLQLITKTFQCERLRHSSFRNRLISKVALCGGSGASLVEKAISMGADAFLTGEGKYNDFFNHTDEILFVDAGHYETEQFTKEIFFELLSKNFPTFAVRISSAETNPVHYF
jgi:dinuclear metal center YbgI/SA1388 family protein